MNIANNKSWVGYCDVFNVVQLVVLAPPNPGSIPAQTLLVNPPGTFLGDDQYGYRALMSWEVYPSLNEAGSDDGYLEGMWVSFGILRTQFNTDNQSIGVGSPFWGGVIGGAVNQGDIEQGWIYRWSESVPTHRADGNRWDVANSCPLSTVRHSFHTHHDIPIRRGRGTTVVDRDAVLIVFSLDECPQGSHSPAIIHVAWTLTLLAATS